ncbi:chondroitinase-B domain-containing protein [Alteromonas sp. M12]|uniref:chondroitinase-B domain-containing protein n=1 Tax=Alteromonas sp. M12 TaxID=3135644 RepID=UPI00319DE987
MKFNKAGVKKLAIACAFFVFIASAVVLIFLQTDYAKELTIKGRQYVQINLHKNWGIRLTLLKSADLFLKLIPQPSLIPFDKEASGVGVDHNKIIDSHSIKALSLLASNFYPVQNVEELRSAMLKARKGDVILLYPGHYSILKRLEVRHHGSQDSPIRLLSSVPGTSILEIKNTEGIYLNKSNWRIENLTFQGACGQQRYCEHAIHMYGNADQTQLINNQFIDFNAALKANGNYQQSPAVFADNVLVQHNDFYNQTLRKTDTPATPIDVVGGNNWLVDNNFIADFARQLSGRVSVTYGGFMKGGGSGGVFSNNVVNCAWHLPYQSSLDVRVGLSFGDGGTQDQFCQNTDCEYEHFAGKIKNNLVLNCINDVSIYLNKAADTEISGNTILNSVGIDARYKQTSVKIFDNRLNGRINARDNAFISQRDNVMVK